MQHRTLESGEESQQLGEGGAIQPAGGAVGSRADGQGIADASDGNLLFAAHLTTQDHPRRPPRHRKAEGPGCGVRGQPC